MGDGERRVNGGGRITHDSGRFRRGRDGRHVNCGLRGVSTGPEASSRSSSGCSVADPSQVAAGAAVVARSSSSAVRAAKPSRASARAYGVGRQRSQRGTEQCTGHHDRVGQTQGERPRVIRHRPLQDRGGHALDLGRRGAEQGERYDGPAPGRDSPPRAPAGGRRAGGRRGVPWPAAGALGGASGSPGHRSRVRPSPGRTHARRPIRTRPSEATPRRPHRPRR